MPPTRRIGGLIGLLAIAGVAAGCGAARQASGSRSFAWLASGPAPATWSPAGMVAGGALPRPLGWRAVRGDRGSVSFAQLRVGGAIVGYLNATPHSGAETLANWTRFRVRHNAAEGDRNVRASAGAAGLRIGADHASCVIDDYLTRLSSYREIACLIAGSGASTVVVGASPPSDWSRQRPIIERAIAGFVAS
jgi:hypothetical protein